MDRKEEEALRLALKAWLAQLENDPSIPPEIMKELKEALRAGRPEGVEKMLRVLKERRSKESPPEPDKKA